MRYWYDCEFIEDGITIELISIGIIAEDGREYYAQDKGCDLSRASQWVKDHVLVHLDQQSWKVRSQIRRDLLRFMDIEKYGEPELWGWCAGYDWVALCQLFGTMMDIPGSWPHYVHEIQQVLDERGITDDKLPQLEGQAHNALSDARQIQKIWEMLYC